VVDILKDTCLCPIPTPKVNVPAGYPLSALITAIPCSPAALLIIILPLLSPATVWSIINPAADKVPTPPPNVALPSVVRISNSGLAGNLSPSAEAALSVVSPAVPSLYVPVTPVYPAIPWAFTRTKFPGVV
jgi:hypothetical protein